MSSPFSRYHALAGDKPLLQHFCLHRLPCLGPVLPLFPTPLHSGCSMHPLGHLSGKSAQNKWKTKWQLSRKAVFLVLQSERFKAPTTSGASFLLCLGLFKLSDVCGWGFSERLLCVDTWKSLFRGVESNVGNLSSLPTASTSSTGGYGGALPCCKCTMFPFPAQFQWQRGLFQFPGNFGNQTHARPRYC